MRHHRRPKLPPEWQIYTSRRPHVLRPVRLTRREKKLGGLAAALVFAAVFSGSGSGLPDWRDQPDWSVQDEHRPITPYRNCAAARAAGHAPIRRGEPGYGGHLDRDGDGIGCEWG